MGVGGCVDSWSREEDLEIRSHSHSHLFFFFTERSKTYIIEKLPSLQMVLGKLIFIGRAIPSLPLHEYNQVS